mgnify:CR=1 FL=1
MLTTHLPLLPEHMLRLGRAQVESAFAAMGQSDPTVNVPLMLTREWFAMRMGFTDDQISRAKLMKGTGCKTCNGSGYKGRVALYEVMRFHEPLKDLVLQGASTAELKVAAIKSGMNTLRMAGIEKICQGMTTTEEVGRCTMGD